MANDDEKGVEYLRQVSLVPRNETNTLVTAHSVKSPDPHYLVELAKEVGYYT